MQNTNFETKMNAFWNKVMQRYDSYLEQFAENERQDYYVFQTEYRENPEVMIVGINPGGNCTRNQKWLCAPKGENGYLDGTHQWFVTLRKFFGYPENSLLKDKLDNCVGSNITFINTGNSGQIPKELKSPDFIRELVREIIKPKYIIALGIDPFYALKNKPEKVRQFGSIALKYSEFNGTPICFIPNPSARNTKYYNGNKCEDWQKALEWFLSQPSQ